MNSESQLGNAKIGGRIKALKLQAASSGPALRRLMDNKVSNSTVRRLPDFEFIVQ
jgi:hypothetical protein